MQLSTKEKDFQQAELIDSKLVRYLLVAFLFLFLLLIAPSFPGFNSDMWCWRKWSAHMLQKGLDNAYNGSGSDYLPLYQYFLWIFGRIAGSILNIYNHIGYLKGFTLLFEFWGLWLVYRWLGANRGYVFILCCGMLNISYAYDTMIWGQVDAIEAALVFGALYYAWKQHTIVGGILILLALNMKLQVLPFLPVWGILLLYDVIGNNKWKHAAGMLLAMALFQTAILLPFGWQGTKAIINVAINSAGKYPLITMKANNVWYLFKGIKADATFDNAFLIGTVSYKLAGIILFLTTGIIALLPMLIKLSQILFYHRKDVLEERELIDRRIVWLTSSLLVLLFFFFLTEMHERYAHPAFIFITAYAFYTRRFGLYTLFSVAFFLNLERVLKWLSWPNYHSFAFNPSFGAILYAVIIIWLYYLLYKTYWKTRMVNVAEVINIR